MGLGRPRGAAGQRDPARGAVRDRPREDLRRRTARRCSPTNVAQEGQRPDALLPHLPDARPRLAGRRLLDAEPLARRARARENSYLTASNADLGTILDTLGDRLKGTTIKGNGLELTIRPGRAVARRSSLLAGKCGAAVVLNPKTGAVYVMASSPGFDPNLIETAGRLREDPGDEEPVRARACGAAPEPRHAGPLPAGLDVQDDHRRGGARRRRLHARLDLLRPGLLHRVRQAGLQRARPERARGVRHRELRRGLPALDQRRLLQHRQEARRASGSSRRRRSSASTRCRRSRRPSTRARPRASTRTRKLFDPKTTPATRGSTRAASPSARRRCSTTPLQMAMVAAAIANKGVDDDADADQAGRLARRRRSSSGCTRTCYSQATKPADRRRDPQNMMVEAVAGGHRHARADPGRHRRRQDRHRRDLHAQ